MDLEQILQKAQAKAQLKLQKLATKFENQPQNKLQTEVLPEPVLLRLDVNSSINAYSKINLKPGFPRYWFDNDLEKNPLIRIDILSQDRSTGTPVAALCLLKRSELIDNYIKKNFIDSPSYTWTLGEISQLTGHTPSYLLGFNLGFSWSEVETVHFSNDAILGYQDGESVRNSLIEQKLLPEVLTDEFASEDNSHKLSELYRVGYYR